MKTATLKLPKSIRKHIRKEKNRIRKNIPEGENYKTKIKDLYDKWQYNRASKKQNN